MQSTNLYHSNDPLIFNSNKIQEIWNFYFTEFKTNVQVFNNLELGPTSIKVYFIKSNCLFQQIEISAK